VKERDRQISKSNDKAVMRNHRNHLQELHVDSTHPEDLNLRRSIYSMNWM